MTAASEGRHQYLYNSDPEKDALNIFAFLDGLAEAYDGEIGVSPHAVAELCRSIQTDFPHRKGVDEASVFKKLANFILWFVEYSPIDKLPDKMIDLLPDDVIDVKNYQNVVVALLIGMDAMVGAVIKMNSGSVEIKNRVQLSQHSLVDIVDAIGSITPSTGFKMLTVLLEQLAYKTNPECQYSTFEV